MKRLILIRHAKSSWDQIDLADRARPLNARGLKNAPMMGDVLCQKGVRPEALPGILTGGILAVGRAGGEVAPILFTGAAYFMAELPRSVTHQFMDLGYHTYVLSTQSPDIEKTRPILYATVLVLLILTFSLNAVAVVVVGTNSKVESEGYDRTDLSLPSRQDDLVRAVADRAGTDVFARVRYEPDPRLEAIFGAFPPMRTPRADAAGLRGDGTVAALVERAIAASAG